MFFFEIIQKEIVKSYLEEIRTKIQEIRQNIHEEIMEVEDILCRCWDSLTSLKVAFQEWSDEEVTSHILR
jgi:hypothetical protein